MTFSKKPVKGMSDFLPSDMALRSYVLDEIKTAYRSFGFCEIGTPMMENIANLTSKQGGDNEKLIFKVQKRGASLARAWEKAKAQDDYNGLVDVGLRYDLTVPLARFYAQHKEELPSPFRSLHIGPVWRADQPARGRFRQFTQCDIDILGDASPLAEIELISATAYALNRILAPLDCPCITIHVNDRRILQSAALFAGFEEACIPQVLIILDKLDKIGFEGVRKELTEMGAPEETVQTYLALFEGASSHTSKEFCRQAHIEGLKDISESLDSIIARASELAGEGISICFDPTLVRGMGYYTSTIFEASIDDFGISIAGGGRYDEMIGLFSGENVSACGFSIGFERIITLLVEAHNNETINKQGDMYALLVHPKAGPDKQREALLMANALRNDQKCVAVYPMKKNMRHQIDSLEKAGYTHFEKIYPDKD